MKTLLIILSLYSVGYTINWEKEYPIIEKAALRNNCEGDDFLILLAIRLAERGGEGKEFGIVHPKAWGTNLDTQAGWAACTVVKNRKRYESQVRSGTTCDFITFLGNRYCPIGAANDPKGLNRNWGKNVTYFYNKLKSE